MRQYSGGAHCCYRYAIVSLAPTPRIVHAFDNAIGAGIAVDARGQAYVATAEGAFDYCLLSHADSVMPPVYLRLK